MLVAVILNALSYFLIMGPTVLSMRVFIVSNALDRLSVVTVVHVVFGTTAETLAVAIVAFWHLRRSTQGCVRKRKLMKVTLVLWVLALLWGILLYFVTYS
jgi:hypothetical protein